MEPRRQEDDHNSGRRARELYRYFQPERISVPASSTPSSTEDSPAVNPVPDVSLSPSVVPQTLPLPPSLSRLVPEDALVLGDPNATLNSFAQLAALRLDVERVLVSVSDRDSQFIIAQSTRTPTVNANYSGSGDIWDGCSTLSTRTWKMCGDTVVLPTSSRETSEASFLIVDDLSQDEQYKDLPMVQGGPQFRFYAGTPLTTEGKINIGCFFVLDTKPHNGLSDGEKETLATLSVLIMDYLKVSRQASEGRRAARLSRGLSCFVEGSSSFVDTPDPSYAGSSAAAPSTPSSHQKSNHLSVGSCNSFELPSRRSLSIDARSLSSTDSRGDQVASSNPDTPLPNWWSGSRQKGFEEANGNGWAFRRAANLLRESMELDSNGGVMFLEAGNAPIMDSETGSDCSLEVSTPASVLAISTNEDPFSPGPGSTGLYPATNLDVGFLHELLRRHTKGKLWSFHRDGLLSSSDDEKKSHRARSKATKPVDMARGGTRKWKTLENSMLNLYFPNASQVLFVPLWNAANSQWFAGCFCWTAAETRVFNPSVELSSVMGFASSIMAEYSRVQSLISDQQKGDFIGSISHELRSPLHGILAAAEFLGGTEMDEFQGSLLDTINACGRTLLDTMNQVLDFSKIVSLERSWRQMKKHNKSATTDEKSLERFSAHLDTYVATDLAILTEEVVEGVCLGHAYSERSTTTDQAAVTVPTRATNSQPHPASRSNVEVVVDIAQNDWVYQTQPGALRRIIMNVFGNAMKYTDGGRVSLRLEVTEASDGRSRRSAVGENVTLTVSDTGKGISEEFLRGRLFTPFAQEDTLAAGTGLGLSIVRSLVKSLNGTIHINSQPGGGTTVKVSLPLVRSEMEDLIEEAHSPRSPSALEQDSVSESSLLRKTHAGRRVAILGVDPADTASHGSWSGIARYLTEWYGLELVSWDAQSSVDLVVADEDALSSAKNLSPAIVPALLALCDQSIDHNTARAGCASFADVVNIIRRPCGPHKLARSIRKCLDPQGAAPIPPKHSIVLPSRPRHTTRSSGSDDADSNRSSDDMAELTGDASGTPSSESVSSQASFDFGDSFPAIASSPSALQPLEQSAVAESKPGRSARVLVVDDNSINLKLMLTFMKKRNLATLDSAQNGKLAVDAAEGMQQGYDLIFMDISMPVMNGFEATRAIRSLEKEREGCGPAIIIALTGLSSSRDEYEALASGVDLFLTKPVSFKEVSRLLDEWDAGNLRGWCSSLSA
ncbi:hypothetical protein FE257_006940 [Aspergillus nanangensis]|uniref:histidine kinase n=1 Tax=Aspergillus nanangensis TaxID=2582783 RepID=A0AAD4CNL8_ASPNN|nr:hypothetical protein FE257_006940 [Aspergillus nanangensis]